MYVIKRMDQSGGFVAMKGHKHSYSRNPMYVRVYMTEEEANNDRCRENEIVIPAPDSIARGPF